ncbi:binding partner of ACD11 1-like [Senna tora]|uniref:Binding partner of ACD11 1-like n=1 Tax=Senna tora TaxID=362788 RepID=A0A834TT62_9FABA|nr:binding partner of ACD11 1-like [Senna tora]
MNQTKHNSKRQSRHRGELRRPSNTGRRRVTGLSSKTLERDIYDFFAFSGAIENVVIFRPNVYHTSTAYVTFKDADAQETACLLSGETILDQSVCITRWGHYQDEFDSWDGDLDETAPSQPQSSQFATSAGEVVKTMLTRGCVLSKDALAKAKNFDATMTGKVANLSHRIGLTDKISSGVKAVKSVDQKYYVSESAKSAAAATGRSVAAAAAVTGRSVAAAANTVVNSGCFSNGALWLSGALTRASQVAGGLGSRTVKK